MPASSLLNSCLHVPAHKQCAPLYPPFASHSEFDCVREAFAALEAWKQHFYAVEIAQRTAAL
jgi:hypothetical protein